MIKDTVTIWPLNPIFLCKWFIGIVFMLLYTVFPFWVLVNNQPLNFFSFGYINNVYIQFLIFFPMTIIGVYFALKTGTFFFKVIFTKTHMITAIIPEIQYKKVKIACNTIMSCNVEIQSYFHYHFSFYCSDVRTIKLSLTRFTYKQIRKVLILIQERGGLEDQNLNDIMDSLPKRKKSTKNM